MDEPVATVLPNARTNWVCETTFPVAILGYGISCLAICYCQPSNLPFEEGERYPITENR